MTRGQLAKSLTEEVMRCEQRDFLLGKKKQRCFSFNPHDQPAHTNVFYQVIKVTCYTYEGMKKYRKKHKINHLRTMMAVTRSPIQNSRLSQNSITNLLLFSSYLKKKKLLQRTEKEWADILQLTMWFCNLLLVVTPLTLIDGLKRS